MNLINDNQMMNSSHSIIHELEYLEDYLDDLVNELELDLSLISTESPLDCNYKVDTSNNESRSSIEPLNKSDTSDYCTNHSSPSLNTNEQFTSQNDGLSSEGLKKEGDGQVISKILPSPEKSFYENNEKLPINSLTATQIQMIFDTHPSTDKRIREKCTVSNSSLFGCDINSIERNTGGLILPPIIQNTLTYLLECGLNSVGIFRKSGVKSRIAALRQKMDKLNKSEVPQKCFKAMFDDELCVYDIADIIKLWLRELKPNRIINKEMINYYREMKSQKEVFTSEKLTIGFLLMLSDSERALLQIILRFLSFFASNSDANQMTSHNLGICLMPSLCEFDCSQCQLQAEEPTSESQILYEAQNLLEHLIQKYDELFYLPLSLFSTTSSSVSNDNLLNYGKLINGGNLLPSKHESSILVNACPQDILNRILYQRHQLNPAIIEWKILEQNLEENMDIFSFKFQTSIFLIKKNFTIGRHWRFVNNHMQASSTLSLSRKSKKKMFNGIILQETGHLFESSWKIGTYGEGKSLVEHSFAVDIRGNSYHWYSKIFPGIHDWQLYQLKESFLTDKLCKIECNTASI